MPWTKLAAGLQSHRTAAAMSSPAQATSRGAGDRGIAIGWVPSLLAQDYDGVAIRHVRDTIHSRDVFALLPPGARHPKARQAIDVLRQTGVAGQSPAPKARTAP